MFLSFFLFFFFNTPLSTCGMSFYQEPALHAWGAGHLAFRAAASRLQPWGTEAGEGCPPACNAGEFAFSCYPTAACGAEAGV